MKKVISTIFAGSLLLATSLTALAAPPQAELDEYTKSIGLSQTELEDYLSYYDATLDDFTTIEDLEEFLGDPVTEETLNELLQEFEMTKEELTNLLIEYGELEEGENIEDVFIFIDDIRAIVELDLISEEAAVEIEGLFEEIGLTDAEMEKLFAHLDNVFEQDPSIEEKLSALADRMVHFSEFESADELTAEQIAELLNIFHEMEQLLQIQTKFYLVENGVNKELSLQQLMNIDDPKGASLLIAVYDNAGNFLLDVLFTPEMIGSDIIHQTGQDLKKTEQVVKQVQAKEMKTSKTVKGAKLPQTAGNYMAWTLLGVTLLGFAFLLKKKAGNVR